MTVHPASSGRLLRSVVVLVWVGGTLLASQLSSGAFVWLAGTGFAALTMYPFLRRPWRQLDAGEALYFFVLYYAFAMLLRGVGLLTFVDSKYVSFLGDAQSASYVSLVGWVLFYSAIGLILLYVGYDSPIAYRWSQSLIRWKRGPTAPWREERILPAAIALLAIGAAAAAMRVHTFGGIASITSDLTNAGTSGALGHYWQIALAEFVVVGALVLILRLSLRDSRHRGWKALTVGAAVGAPLFLITSSKFLLLRLIVPPLLFRHFLKRRLSIVPLALLFVAFGALFPFLYAYRALGVGQYGDLSWYLGSLGVPLLLVFNRAYDADSFMLILHSTGSEVPFQWGRSLLDLFTFFIPRGLWPEKPMSFGLIFPDLYMPHVQWGGMTYVSPSLTGELYLNFHLAGIVVGFLLFGMCLRVGYQIARTGAPAAMLIYGYWFLTAVHLVEGSLASQIESFLTGFTPIVLAHLWLRRVPSAQSASASFGSSLRSGAPGPGGAHWL